MHVILAAFAGVSHPSVTNQGFHRCPIIRSGAAPILDPMPLSLRHRLMRPADLPQVITLQHRCYEPAFHESHASFESKLRAAPESCWVIPSDAGALLAYLVTLPVTAGLYPVLHAPTWQAPASANALYLHDMAVSTHLRGRGAARHLLEVAKRYAISSRLPHLNLIAVQNSTAFWRKAGFEACAPTDPDLLNKLSSFGADARLMAQTLSERG